LRARIAQAKAENEAKFAQSQKTQDREVRQRVFQQINAIKQTETRTLPSSPIKTSNLSSDTPCTLQLVIDKQKTTNTLRTVYNFVLEQISGASKKTIAFETVILRQRFESDQFNEILGDFAGTPRARVMVKYH
jgi:hypothetical protein